MNDIKKMLRSKGLRVTPQRELIYRLLLESKAHPTADYVYREVRKTFPAISFNTVYKTVRSLEESGLLQRFNTGDNIYHYDANVSPHPHLICLHCGRVDDMDDFPDDLEGYILKSARSSPGKIQYVNLHFYGCCHRCGDGGIKTKTGMENEKEEE